MPGPENGAVEPMKPVPGKGPDEPSKPLHEKVPGGSQKAGVDAPAAKMNDNIIKDDDKGMGERDRPPHDVSGPADKGTPPPADVGTSANAIAPDKLAALRQKVADWKKAGLDLAALERCLSSERPDPEELRIRLGEFKEKMKSLQKPAKNGGDDDRENGEASKPVKKLKKVVKVDI